MSISHQLNGKTSDVGHLDKIINNGKNPLHNQYREGWVSHRLWHLGRMGNAHPSIEYHKIKA